MDKNDTLETIVDAPKKRFAFLRKPLVKDLLITATVVGVVTYVATKAGNQPNVTVVENIENFDNTTTNEIPTV